MSARDDILAAVRAAVATAPEPPAVPRAYRGHPSPEGLVDLFLERVADYRATVMRCAPGDLLATVERALGRRRSVIVPRGLPIELPYATTDSGHTATELDRFDAVVTTAAVGIAQTGTLVLDHGPGQGRRALSLVPDRHVCLVRAGQVVSGVPEAIARLDPGRPQTWISGPSATSDIELSRVEGVHGPRTLIVVLVDGA